MGTCPASVRVLGTCHAWVVGTCHASGVGICHGTLVTLEWWALVTLEWWALSIWVMGRFEVGRMMKFWLTSGCRTHHWSRLQLEVRRMTKLWLTSRRRMHQWSRLHLEVSRKVVVQKWRSRAGSWGWGLGLGLGLGARAFPEFTFTNEFYWSTYSSTRQNCDLMLKIGFNTAENMHFQVRRTSIEAQHLFHARARSARPITQNQKRKTLVCSSRGFAK